MNEKIRKNWLIALFVFHIGTYAIGLLDQLFGRYIDIVNGDIFYGDGPWRLFLFLFVSPLGHVFFGSLTYYFAYHKKRNGFLIAVMAYLTTTSVFCLVTFIALALVNRLHFVCQTGTVQTMVYGMCFSYLSIYYLFNCYRLYKLNRTKIAEVIS